MIETSMEIAGSSSRSYKGNRRVDFAPWTSLPPLSTTKPVVEQSNTAGPDPLERTVALLILILATPVLLLIAFAIKLESPLGPVFYRQERVGLDRRKGDGNGHGIGDGTFSGHERRKIFGRGRSFLIWKFRTMIPDAESKTGPVWAQETDPRVTRVGNILRKARMDEVPQLINVVAGQMRLIGPRPERPVFVERLSEAFPEYPQRLQVPPGITGLAQVQRSYDTDLNDVRKKLMYDLFYVENRSPTLNMKILMKTVGVVLNGRGAR